MWTLLSQRYSLVASLTLCICFCVDVLLPLPTDQTTQQYQEVQIPEVVKNFIVFFHRNILENNVYELHSIYEHSFNKLTEKFYAKESWPEPEAISPLVNDGNST